MRSYLFDYPRLKDFPKKNPDSMLLRACDGITLPQLKGSFDIWCQIAVISETKAYNTDEEREVIKLFRTDFSALIDAMFCIVKSMENELKEKEYDQEIRYYIVNYYKPEEEPIPPFEFPEHFFSKIDLENARSLLWILLEAVIIYKGDLKEQLDNNELLISYERFLVILEGAYSIMKMVRKRDSK